MAIFSVLWQEGKGSAVSVTIVLHSCSAAKFAEKVSKSKKIANVTIIGATTPIVVQTGKDSRNFYGSWLENKGVWKSYKAGKELKSQSYGTYSQPGSIYKEIKFNCMEMLSKGLQTKLWKK